MKFDVGVFEDHHPTKKFWQTRTGRWLIGFSILQFIVGLYAFHIIYQQHQLLLTSKVANGEMYPTEVAPPTPTSYTYVDEWRFGVDGEADWDSIFPKGGGGYLHLGPDKRRYGIAMFHQLHCLDSIRKSLIVGDAGGHAGHCFNYLRQAILCHADHTLEPYVDVGIGAGIVHHTCRNWNELYEIAETNWAEFTAWKDARINNQSG